MIVQNKTVVSHATLAAAAQLTANIMMRLAGNGVAEAVTGSSITRTTVAAGALSDASKVLKGL